MVRLGILGILLIISSQMILAQCQNISQNLFYTYLQPHNHKELYSNYTIDSSRKNATIYIHHNAKLSSELLFNPPSYAMHVYGNKSGNPYIFNTTHQVIMYHDYIIEFDYHRLDTMSAPTLYLQYGEEDTTIVLPRISQDIFHFYKKIKIKNTTQLQLAMININSDTMGNSFALTNMQLYQCNNYYINKTPIEKFKRRILKSRGEHNFFADTLSLRLFEVYGYDGDVVDVYINGRLIAKKYKCVKNAPIIPIILHQEFTEIVIHTKRYGFAPPCSAMLGIISNDNEAIIKGFTIDKQESLSLWLRCKKFSTK